MQTFAIVVSFAITAVALVYVTIAVRSMLRVIRLGQPDPSRTGNPVGRTVTMIKESLLHTRMLQWHWVGALHWFVYAAFLLLSSAVLAGYFQLFNPEFALPIIGHWFLFEWVCEAIGLLSTIAIVILIVYRQVNHPRRKGRNSRFYGSNFWQAYFVEAMVLLEGSAILFIRGAEFNLGQLGEHAERFTRFHFPISGYVGDLLYPSGPGTEATLATIIVTIAMMKILLAMVWLIVISRNLTMGVAWHRFLAWFNIWFKRYDSGRTSLGALKPLLNAGAPVKLEDIDELDEDARLGVGAVEDFTWKGMLDFTTCTECGRCQSQCPAWNTEKPLSPKLMIMSLRDHAMAKGDYLLTDPEQRGGLSATALAEAERPLVGATEGDPWRSTGGGVIDPDVLWSCVTCGACVQQCPVDIEHVDHVVDMRRYQVLVESNFPAELNQLFRGMEGKGNPWNMAPTARMDWAQGLDFDVPVVGEDLESLDSVDWLFWVGCAGAYEDRAKKTTRAVAELLNIAGVSFGVLGNGETCTGDSARRAGNEFVFQGLATQNIETFKEYRVKKVVSTCAHCFNTLKNEYKELGIELEVVHHTQLLNRLVREGKLTPVAEGAGAAKRSITYHDPCYIGRHNQVYSPPRELLEILPGADFVEMDRNSERSFCCGAGGARMWMEEKLGSRINMNRTTEAVGTGADQIAVGCPFCRVMLSDGLSEMQDKGEARAEVEVLDVAQMLLASVKGEPATKAGPGTTPAARATPAAPAPPAAPPAPAAPAAPAAPVEPAVGGTALAGGSLFDSPTPDAAAPAAPAGGSLFDTPAPDAAPSGGSLFDSPAPAAPAGGSLFDTPEPAAPGGGSLFDTPAPDAPPSGGSLFDTPAPSAPASGGSLFDTPAPSEPTPGGSLFDTPAPPAPGGGSLFDVPEAEAPSSLFDVPAEPAPATPAQPPQTDGEIPAGQSLFDIPAAEPATGTGAAPLDTTVTAPSTEDARPAGEAQTVASTPLGPIPEGQSLFDVPKPEAASPADAEAHPEPAGQAEPAAVKLGPIPEGQSLFDVPASAAEASAPVQAEPAAVELGPIPEGQSLFAAPRTEIFVPGPAPKADPPAEHAGEPATPAVVPFGDIPEGQSLFDLPGSPEPEATAEPEVVHEPEAAPQPVTPPLGKIPEGKSLFDL